jgi:serine/threonine protein kinase/Flp pilus assembly protein TadD
MGVVYLARQLSLGRLVALKMLPADLAGDEVALARFRREMRLLARCDHPNIVKVLASGTLPDGQLYYAMEYVPGSNLEQVWSELAGSGLPGDPSTLGSSTWARAVLSASRKAREQSSRPSAPTESSPLLPLPPLPELPSAPDDPGGYARRVVMLVRDAALALQAVHDQQVIHRDVKPANLMLSPDGARVVLMDFGLAKGQDRDLSTTHAGGLLGTLRYAAPEQLAAASLRVGPEADVRGLGVTLWELLTRRRLFAEAEDERQLATMVHDHDVPRLRANDPGFDRDLEAIVARATERRVADRISKAGQLAEYLQLYLDGKTLPIRPPTMVELAGRWAHRNRAVVGTVAAVLILGTVLAVTMKIAADSRFHRLQAESEADVERGNTALLKADLQNAQGLLAGALGKIGSEPRLRTLRRRAEGLLAEANRRLEEQIERQRDRARHETFLGHYDDALLHGTLFSGRDSGASDAPLHGTLFSGRDSGAGDALLHETLFSGRDSGAERAKASAWKALEVFGVKEDGAAAAPLDLSALHLEDREKARVRACCYELLMLLALLESPEGVPAPATPGRPASLSQRAREILDRAGRLIPEARTSRLLSDRDPGEPAARRADRSPDADLFGAVERFLIGLLRYFAQDFNQAGRQFEGALQAFPDHYWSQYFLALCHLRTRRWGEARIGFYACLARKPSSPWPLMLRGYVAGEMLDFEAAERDLAAALGLAPDDYGILVNRGAMRIRRGRFAEAADDLRRAIAREPHQYQAYANLARVFSAQELWSEAIEQIDQAIRLAPRLALLHRNRARIHLEAGKKPEAQRDYARAISLEPAGSPFVYLWRAEDHLAHRRYREAVQSFDLYEHLVPPDAQSYQGRALARTKLGDYAGAVEDYSRSLGLEPNSNVSARRGWAYTLYHDQLALHEFERSLKLNDKNLDAHAGRGYILARLGRYREAVREAEVALPPGIQDWEMPYNVACIYAQAAAKAGADTASPDHLALADRYGAKAVMLIRSAFELARDPVQRSGVWRTMVADSALDPLRGSPGFARLETDFGGRRP